MSSWGSYPSIFTMGHKAVKDLLMVDVNVEEKVDGSQFSFGLVEASDVDPVYSYGSEFGQPYALKIRSKGAVMHIDAPERMFSLAAETVKKIAHLLHPGWTYRGEYLARPKHNALAYDRVPGIPCSTCKGKGYTDTGVLTGPCLDCNNTGQKNTYIIIFDVTIGDQEYLSYEDKLAEATRLGLETVPLLFSGRVADVGEFRSFLDRVSVLGGQKIEGVVVKPRAYDLFGTDKKVLLGKFVSEAFKEVHRKAWGESNPTGKDIFGMIGQSYCTPARWNKAIQHLREAGKLVDDVQDIGPIMKEIPEDVLKECEDDLKNILFKWAWPHIRRQLTTGFPQWYKEQLLKRSFEHKAELPQELGVTGEMDDRIIDSDRDCRSDLQVEP